MKKLLGGLAILTLILFVSCNKKDDNTIVIGHKNFTEQRILGEMGAVLIEKNTDYKARVREFGGTMLVDQGMKTGDIDLSFEYTGTGYLYLLGASGLKDPDKIYNYVKNEFEKQGMMWLSTMGFENAYALAVRKDTAEKYNLKKISDFKDVAHKLTIGELGDFFEREDGMPGITEAYGFSFGREINMDPGLKYRAISQKEIDVAVVYTTDALIEKYNLIVLEDDKNFFPPYDTVPRVSTEFANKYPEIVAELEKLNDLFTNEDFIRYNYEAEVVGTPIRQVAKEILLEKGLIK